MQRFFYFVLLSQNQLHGELFNAGIACIDIAGVGCGHGIKIVVRTNVLILTVQIGHPDVGLGNVGVGAGSSILVQDCNLACIVGGDVDVLLCTVDGGEEAFSLSYIPDRRYAGEYYDRIYYGKTWRTEL